MDGCATVSHPRMLSLRLERSWIVTRQQNAQIQGEVESEPGRFGVINGHRVMSPADGVKCDR
jgi:hypothetical protein